MTAVYQGHTRFYIQDYGLSALQLDCKYSPDGDGEHPGYRRWDWRQTVASDSTLLGYWAWVQAQLEEERDELDLDNPYL